MEENILKLKIEMILMLVLIKKGSLLKGIGLRNFGSLGNLGIQQQ